MPPEVPIRENRTKNYLPTTPEGKGVLVSVSVLYQCPYPCDRVGSVLGCSGRVAEPVPSPSAEIQPQHEFLVDSFPELETVLSY